MGLLTVGGIQIDVGANTAPLKNDLANAQRELESFGRLMGSSGSSSTGLGAPFAQANQQAGGFLPDGVLQVAHASPPSFSGVRVFMRSDGPISTNRASISASSC